MRLGEVRSLYLQEFAAYVGGGRAPVVLLLVHNSKCCYAINDPESALEETG